MFLRRNRLLHTAIARENRQKIVLHVGHNTPIRRISLRDLGCASDNSWLDIGDLKLGRCNLSPGDAAAVVFLL